MELFEFIMDLIAAYLIFVLILAILQIVAWWRIFSKAGEAGWKSIIPIYNVIVLFKICGLSPLFCTNYSNYRSTYCIYL